MKSRDRDDIIATFRRVTEDCADFPAILIDDLTVTYGKLADRVDETMAALILAGVRAGDIVHVPDPVSADSAVAQALACWTLDGVLRLGGDPNGASQQAARPKSPNDSRIFTPVSAKSEQWREMPPSEPWDELLSSVGMHRPALRREGGGYIVMSSGSTSRPKTILGSRRSLSTFAHWQRIEFEIGPGDFVPALTSISFDVVYRELFTTLSAGATLVCPPPRLPPGRVLGWLADVGATRLHVVPSIARSWIAAASRGGQRAPEVPSLRTTFFAGEALDADLIREWRAVTREGAEVVNLYGPSETTLAKLFHRVPAEVAGGVQPVGLPLPGSEVSVVDDQGEELPFGEIGEVQIQTSDASLGYLRATAAEAVAFSAEGAQVTFRTGDLGRIGPSGLTVLGRIGSNFKVNGVWINVHDIETALRRHPAVQDAAVVPQRYDVGVRVAAIVAAVEQVDARDLRSQVLHEVGRQGVPSALLIVARIPRLASGKIDRVGIRGLFGFSDERTADSVLNDPTAAEAIVVRLCSQILGVEVGLNDDLLEQGLDELRAIDLCARLDTLAQTRVEPEDVLAAPQAAAIAMLVCARETAVSKRHSN